MDESKPLDTIHSIIVSSTLLCFFVTTAAARTVQGVPSSTTIILYLALLRGPEGGEDLSHVRGGETEGQRGVLGG